MWRPESDIWVEHCMHRSVLVTAHLVSNRLWCGHNMIMEEFIHNNPARNPFPNSAPSSLSLLSVEMDQNASECVWTDVKCTISVFLKAINNFQSTFITYMVIKAMAPESPAFRESYVRNHSRDMTTILKQDPPFPLPTPPPLFCACVCEPQSEQIT